MTRAASAWLLVRVGRRLVGLSLPRVAEVLEPGPVHAVPSADPAVRGVTSIRGRILPVIHLGALLEGGGCPAIQGETLVVVEMDGRRVCFEVEDAEEVFLGAGLPVTAAAALPWATAVARHGEGLVPLLDLDGIGTRIREAASA
jgi:chemotaxis signal transduction protein